jgi:hypothetical protein
VLLRHSRCFSRDARTVGHFSMLPSGVRTCPNAILVRTTRLLKRQVSLIASNSTVLLERIELLRLRPIKICHTSLLFILMVYFWLSPYKQAIGWLPWRLLSHCKIMLDSQLSRPRHLT